MARDPYFDYGEILLPIAIVVASVAMLANSKAAYAFGLTPTSVSQNMSRN